MSLSSGTELHILKGRTYSLIYLAVEDSKRHLSGPEFDSQWERISGPGLNKYPYCVLPALKLRLMFATLWIGSRCRSPALGLRLLFGTLWIGGHCRSPALGLRLLFATLQIGSRCRVGSCKRPVNDGRLGFEGFLDRDLWFRDFLIYSR
jgi:hypothetical protein